MPEVAQLRTEELGLKGLSDITVGDLLYLLPGLLLPLRLQIPASVLMVDCRHLEIGAWHTMCWPLAFSLAA